MFFAKKKKKRTTTKKKLKVGGNANLIKNKIQTEKNDDMLRSDRDSVYDEARKSDEERK